MNPELIPAEGKMLMQVSYNETAETILGENGVLTMDAGTVIITTHTHTEEGVDEEAIHVTPDFAISLAKNLLRAAFHAKVAQARAKREADQ